jgi:hypothetical protein
VVVRRFPSLGTAGSRSLRYTRMKEFVRRSICVPFRRFLGGVSREFMQRFYVVIHAMLGS